MKNSLTGVVTDITEGTVADDKVDFTISVTQPFPLSMAITATYEGATTLNVKPAVAYSRAKPLAIAWTPPLAAL